MTAAQVAFAAGVASGGPGESVWTPFVRLASRTAHQFGAHRCEKGERGHAQRHLAVSPVPEAHFAVNEAEFSLGGAKAGLDGPAQPSHAGQLGKRVLPGASTT